MSNGTLVVNNWMNTDAPVFVYPGGTLGGIGTVGIVSNLGGTVKGSLHMRQLRMNAAATVEVTLGGTNATMDYSQLSVSEALDMAGATLNLTLTFAPPVGQAFTIIRNAPGAAVSGTFANGRVASAVFNGRTYFFAVDYAGGDGNDIVLTALPTGFMLRVR